MLNSTIATQIFKLIFAKSKAITGLNGTGVCYLGLSIGDPGADGANFKEPAIGETTGYARVLINANDAMEYTDLMAEPAIDSESGKVMIKNVKEIVLPEAKTDWGTFTHFGIFNAETGGTPLIHHPLTADTPDENGEYPETTITVNTGEVILFRKEQLKIFL